jgi:diazepam-binding inhibitor (GABA receptor modulator, acyl-CoA-binding protein)
MIEYDSGEELETKFNIAANEVKKLRKRPLDAELLLLYGLYKQAIDGNYRESQKPSFFDAKNLAKWNAWRVNRGMTKSRAMTEYIQLVGDMKNKYNK